MISRKPVNSWKTLFFLVKNVNDLSHDPSIRFPCHPVRTAILVTRYLHTYLRNIVPLCRSQADNWFFLSLSVSFFLDKKLKNSIHLYLHSLARERYYRVIYLSHVNVLPDLGSVSDRRVHVVYSRDTRGGGGGGGNSNRRRIGGEEGRASWRSRRKWKISISEAQYEARSGRSGQPSADFTPFLLRISFFFLRGDY